MSCSFTLHKAALQYGRQPVCSFGCDSLENECFTIVLILLPIPLCGVDVKRGEGSFNKFYK